MARGLASNRLIDGATAQRRYKRRGAAIAARAENAEPLPHFDRAADAPARLGRAVAARVADAVGADRVEIDPAVEHAQFVGVERQPGEAELLVDRRRARAPRGRFGLAADQRIAELAGRDRRARA